MTELIRQWIIAVTCAAMLAAILQTLLPKGGTGAAGRLAGGLLLLIATVQPLLSLDYDSLAQSMTQLRLEEYRSDQELAEANSSLLEELIEQETRSYILDKAEELGVVCQVRVTAWTESGDYPVPDGLEITGDLTQGEQAALTRVIAAELAIPAEQQYYVEDVE